MLEVVRTAKFGEKAWSATAAASSGELLYVAWAGQEGELRLASSPDGFTFSTPEHLPFRSEGMVSGYTRKSRRGSRGTLAPMRPGLAASTHGVDLAVLPDNGKLRLLRTTSSRHWQEIETGQRTNGSPSLAPLADELLTAWVGSDLHLNLATTLGSSLTAPRRLDETTPYSPSISTSGDETAMAWTGTDLHLNVAVGTAGCSFASQWRLDETSSEGPAVCAVGLGIAIAWVGQDYRLNVGVVVNGHLESTIHLDERTYYEPQLARHGDDLFLVWTGTKGEVCLAQLRV